MRTLRYCNDTNKLLSFIRINFADYSLCHVKGILIDTKEKIEELVEGKEGEFVLGDLYKLKCVYCNREIESLEYTHCGHCGKLIKK